MKTIRLLLMLMAALVLSSCEKFYADGTLSNGNGENGNVTIQVSNHIQSDFVPDGALTRGNDGESEDTPMLEDICTRLSFAFFKDGEKIKTINQTAGDDNYGTVSLHLAEGTYNLVIIAHSGKGNCTISSPEKVKFYNNKMTDTFIHYGTLNVAEDDETRQEINLSRAVAKITLHFTDALPAYVKRFRFYYTGGSSTLNAVTGQGCVNSRQTEELTAEEGQKDYSIYTFPHQDDKNVALSITAYDSEETEVATRYIENIPVKRNQITTCIGNLLDGSESSPSDTKETTAGIVLKFDSEWAGELIYQF